MQWFWQPRDWASSKGSPFTLPCDCGRVLTGTRKKTHQIVSCPGCKSKRFVLPRSPFSEEEPKTQTPPPASSTQTRVVFLSRVVLLGIVVVLLSLLVGIIAQLYSPTKSTNTPTSPKPELSRAEAEKQIRKHLNQARDHITAGQFYLAQPHLKAIQKIHKTHPNLVIQKRALNQKIREVGIFADLLDVSLEDLLHQVTDRGKDDWLATFQNRYQGKSIILDTRLRSQDGHLVCDYQIYGKDGCIATLQVQDLVAAKRLWASQVEPDDGEPKPLRVIFGARLEAIEPVSPKIWRVRFDSDSGVILTDYEALLICCPAYDNEATAKCVWRQDEWNREQATENK